MKKVQSALVILNSRALKCSEDVLDKCGIQFEPFYWILNGGSGSLEEDDQAQD